MSTSKTLFQKIIDREIPAQIEFEDERVIVLRDISPQAPTHLLVIPKKPIPSVAELSEEDAALAGHLLTTAAQVAKRLGLTQGFRLVINCGADAGMSVPHLHVHLLGGRALNWPPG